MSGPERSDAPRRAVALRYERERASAPEVVAHARGALAERVLELAREHGVPVREDADLVELLGACEVGEEIPVELYTAVAELLTYLWRLNGELAADEG